MGGNKKVLILKIRVFTNDNASNPCSYETHHTDMENKDTQHDTKLMLFRCNKKVHIHSLKAFKWRENNKNCLEIYHFTLIPSKLLRLTM